MTDVTAALPEYARPTREGERGNIYVGVKSLGSRQEFIRFRPGVIIRSVKRGEVEDESVLEDKMLKACWHVCWWPMRAIAKNVSPSGYGRY